MYRIILFGAASGSDKIMKMLDFTKCVIIAYIDNDITKHHSKKNNIDILLPEEIINVDYDYIILTSQHYKQMKKQLIELNVDEKIIIEKPSQLYKYDFNNFKSINTKFTIISDDCFGGYVYNLLGVEYSSPFLWTYIENDDYITLLENYDNYIQKELIFINSKYNYPTAKLGDATIQFMHCENEHEAKQCWYKRIKRMNSNLYVKMTCDNEDIIKRFNKLPFKNKVCFTYNCYDNYESCVWIKDFKSIEPTCNSNVLTTFLDHFDIYKWIK
jgi:uncharacterized protein (DUF1919 family)